MGVDLYHLLADFGVTVIVDKLADSGGQLEAAKLRECDGRGDCLARLHKLKYAGLLRLAPQGIGIGAIHYSSLLVSVGFSASASGASVTSRKRPNQMLAMSIA